MNEAGNNRPVRRRKSRKRELLTILVLLLLCVVSVVYILTHFGRQERSAEEPVEETAVTEETEAAGEAEEEPDAAAANEIAAEHVYSHRGAAGDDELTFITYDRVVNAGSRYLEADMVVSASGTIYLAHDDNAYEMTGVNGYFSGMVDSQIDALKTRSGNNVIRLEDLFERYGDSVTYIVDVKYTSSRNIEAFTNLVKESGVEDNVIAASSYFDALRPLEDAFPEMTKLYICADQATFDAALGHDYVDIISVSKELMTADNLSAARSHDKKFGAWTLNTEDEIRGAIDMGIDSYFTDESELAIGLEKEYRTE